MTLLKSQAQIGAVEFMGGDKYLHYQHSLGQTLKRDSKFGWQHIATFIQPYKTSKKEKGISDELMNQVYITARLNGFVSLKGGLFYTNVGGYQPSFGVEFFVRKKDWLFVLTPRAEIAKDGAYEVFALAEFTPNISKNTKLYVRLQAMSNANTEHHNRSYQMIRVGFDVKGFQLGAGLTLDEYGTSGVTHYNTGVFIRRMI